MNWDDYVRKMLKEPSCLDNITLSFGNDTYTSVPPIIKASLFILDQIYSDNDIYNVLVFPERIQTSVIFAIGEVINKIATGKIQYNYDPYKFKKGQKLKFGNYIVRFLSIDKCEDGKERIFVRFAESLTYGLPIEVAPYFQSTDTERPLSRFRGFRTKDSIFNYINASSDIIELLKNHKTHLKSTVFYVTTVTGAKEFFRSVKINNRKINDILLLGQVNYKGEIKNIGTEQLSGIPAITLSPDLYSVLEAVSKGIETQSIILDVSNNVIMSQLDALDQLCRLTCPIVLITDMESSFDLDELVNRDFNIWRWNEESITKDMLGSSNTIIDKKLRNCTNTIIEYCTARCPEICDSLELLYKHREDVRIQSPAIINVYDKLYRYTITALRNIMVVSSEKIASITYDLERCLDLLALEKRYISVELYKNLRFVIDNLLRVYSACFTFPKIDLLLNKIISGLYKKIILITPDKEDKNSIYQFWKNKLEENGYDAEIEVLYPNEYVNFGALESDITVLTGWFGRKTMQRILYSYNSCSYLVLLYEYENRWKKVHTKEWNIACSRAGNKNIVEKSLGKDVLYIAKTDYSEIDSDIILQESITDELEEIDLVLRENKYRQYTSNPGTESTEAIPVNFAGGYFAFFTPTRKLIVVTDIIISGARRIAIKTADKLCAGDFIVIRETQRDLIREIADIILDANGKKECRQKAFKWIEALRIEETFCDFDDIYNRLQIHGCTKDRFTVRRWITDEDAIIPQDKSDIVAIAKAVDDQALLDEVDEIYEAGRTVVSAHIKAGRVISEKLRRRIADELHSRQKIDPYNILDPITFNIDDIGKVHVLKIDDIIKEPVIIETGAANRLFSF